MDLKIKDKVAVVTAASRGLGRAAAEALAAEGVKLAICSRDRAAIDEAAGQIRKKFAVEVLSEVCDVSSKTGIEAFKDKVIEHFGTCHILFANAGGPPPGKVEEFAEADFRKALDLNLLSTINLVNAFLPFMKQQEWGRILASTSISVKQPIPTLALSNVSRAGVVAFIKSLSLDIAHLNISANVLAPGFIMTGRVKSLLQDRAQREGTTYEEALENVKNTIPAQKIGDPEDFGALCAFLASGYASYITGDTILIDGGMYKGIM
ncbi:MAG: SDR family oxidoreductase [Candidatus Aminicenantes bacterium]|nr:SDR family oxidoreductase [Candidatus Aminicenantes bacterium]